MQHEIRGRKSAEIRFQYIDVYLDGFQFPSLTPKRNHEHLLQVRNKLGAKSLSLLFLMNCTLYHAPPGHLRTLAASQLERHGGIVVTGTIYGHRMPGFKPQFCHSLICTTSSTFTCVQFPYVIIYKVGMTMKKLL